MDHRITETLQPYKLPDFTDAAGRHTTTRNWAFLALLQTCICRICRIEDLQPFTAAAVEGGRTAVTNTMACVMVAL